MPTFIPDLLALLRSAEGLAWRPGILVLTDSSLSKAGGEGRKHVAFFRLESVTATNQVFDGPHLIVVLPLTWLRPGPAAMPTPRRERAEGPVLARAVTLARGYPML